jgi:hypothetical protein
MLSEYLGEPSDSNDLMTFALWSALTLCICQITFYGLTYRFFGRIDPIRIMPLLVLVSVFSVWTIQGQTYGNMLDNGLDESSASGWSSSFATIQGIAQAIFIFCFWWFFRKRRAKRFQKLVPGADYWKA